MAATSTPMPPAKRRGRKRKTPSTTTTTTSPHHRHHNPALSRLIPAVSSALSAAHAFLLSHDLHLLPSHSLSLESTLSSASLSLQKLQSFLQIRPQNPPFPPPPPPTNSWFERFLLHNGDSYPRWVETFRMSKSTFCVLSSTLSEHLSSSLPSIPPNFALGAALYRLAHNGSFFSVGRRFGLTSADACRAFYTVCKVICSQMGAYLGEFGSEMGKISKGFEGISLPNCCGVLGMEKFWVNGKVLGENGFLIVQALVDSEGRFLDVSAGWPGTFSPASIFPQTRLYLGVEESKELLNGSPYELSDGDLLPQYILGDSCYPLLPWLLTPFEKRGEKQDWGLKEMEFNYVHKSAMGFVRMAFGRVRANWELLNRRWKEESVEFLPFIIMTACLLNNFLVKHGETLPDGQPRHDEGHSFPAFEGEVSETAVRTRDLLAMHLSWVSQRH